MSNAELTEEIRAFLQQYAAAFDTLDGDRIAPLYHLPTLTLRGDGSIHCLQSRADLAKFFQMVADLYDREGASPPGMFKDLQVHAMGSRSALATVVWVLRRADGSTIREWRQSYNLVRGAAGWQILVSTFHVA
jgi:ketosteroid isomerase-like protein